MNLTIIAQKGRVFIHAKKLISSKSKYDNLMPNNRRKSMAINNSKGTIDKKNNL